MTLLDKPTEGINPFIVHHTGGAIDVLRDQSTMAIVLAEHYVGFSFDFSDHFIVLKRGEVINAMPKNIATRGAAVYRFGFDFAGYWLGG